MNMLQKQRMQWPEMTPRLRTISHDKDGNVITNLDGPLLSGEDIPDALDLPPGEELDVDIGAITKDEIIKNCIENHDWKSPRTGPNST